MTRDRCRRAGGSRRSAPRARRRAADPRRRPARLHQGHPGAPARLPPPARRRAPSGGAGRAGPGRGAVARADPALRGAPARGERAGRARSTASSARPTGARSSTSAGRSRATELAALYATADVAWIASLRDGMNLVAKEFVACQRDRRRRPRAERVRRRGGRDGRGDPRQPVRRAGLRGGAGARAGDGRGRARASARPRCSAASAATPRWPGPSGRSMDLVAAAQRSRAAAVTDRPAAGRDDLARDFAAARRRICYLDYDGTLVPLAAPAGGCRPRPRRRRDPRRAGRTSPAPTVVDRLRPARRRSRPLVRAPAGAWLAAEHGALMREPGGRRLAAPAPRRRRRLEGPGPAGP